ncbi:MAG: HAD family phosphatase [Bacilli bacterium]|nr:HAD family phosphatase [Bacilli bacterium]
MLIKNHEIKGVIFDLDGTLVDSCTVWAEVDRDFFKKRNMDVPSDYSKAIAHMGLDKAAIYTKERFNLPESTDEILEEWKNLSVHRYEQDVELKSHAKEFIQYLYKNGIKLAVATANEPNCYEPCLKRHGIYEYFSFVENVRKFPNGKKTPDIYLDVANKLSLKPEECLVIEDIVVALKSAKSASFKTVAIYEKTCNEENLKKEISDIYIKDFIELIND